MSHLTNKNAIITTQQHFNDIYMEETVHDLTLKIRQQKNWGILLSKEGEKISCIGL